MDQFKDIFNRILKTFNVTESEYEADYPRPKAESTAGREDAEVSLGKQVPVKCISPEGRAS